MVQHDELFAYVDFGGDRLVRKVLGADEYDLVRHLVLAEQTAQSQDVNGGLDCRGSDLGAVGLIVDHRERFDLHDVKDTIVVEGDQIGFEVDVVSADIEPEQRVVVKSGGGIGVGRGAGELLPGPGVPNLLAGVASDIFEIGAANLADFQIEGLPHDVAGCGKSVDHMIRSTPMSWR